MTQLELHFAGQRPALVHTVFRHPLLGNGGGPRHAVRGRDEGAHPGCYGSFQWSRAVQALSLFLLRWAAWARRPRRNGSAREPLFEGRHGSPAASLNFALSKKNGWLSDMFGCDGSGDPLLLLFIKRSNPDLKRPDEPVGLALHQASLPPGCIKVFVDGAPCDEPEHLDRLAEAIEQQWDGAVEVAVAPAGRAGDGASIHGRVHTGAATGMRVKLKLDRDFDHYVHNQDEKRRLMRMIWDGLRCASAREVSIRKGCVELTLELTPEEAERLYWAARGGALDDFGLIEVELIEPSVGPSGAEAAAGGEAAGRGEEVVAEAHLVTAASPMRSEAPADCKPPPAPAAPGPPATSQSLLSSMRAHHDSGWQRFCELYAPLVTYWCHRSRLSAADTEDVVQEIFLNVYHHITQFGTREPRPGSFRRWLRAVAQNAIAEHRRCKRRQVQTVAESDMDQPLADAVPAPARAEPDAEERRILYHRALELIRPEVNAACWQAFRQTAIEGRAADDVAADLGMSPGAVYAARARVVQKLRRLVGELLA